MERMRKVGGKWKRGVESRDNLRERRREIKGEKRKAKMRQERKSDKKSSGVKYIVRQCCSLHEVYWLHRYMH